jgi:homoserine O-succinyltransferase
VEGKMPIRVQSDLPAKKILEDENIFMMDESRALHQDIRPLEIALLNLMPLKEDTEVQMLRSMSNTPLQLNLTFLTTASYIGKNTAVSHLEQFYQTFDEIKDKKFDGLVITGAPVELMEYEDVAYWNEVTKIMAWSDRNVTSTYFQCWGAQAGLYYFHGLKKYMLDRKLFGIYRHHVNERKLQIVRGFDDTFYAPHSRYTEVRLADIEKCSALEVVAQSDEAGAFIVMEGDGKRVFVMGHPEYDRMTLDKEYKRDKAKGIDIQLPCNYYPEDDPDKRPVLSWRSHCNTLYSNWLNYYVYQITPYEL